MAGFLMVNRLLPATVAVRAKAPRLKDNGAEGTPYPLMTGKDLLGKDLIVSLTMKSDNYEFTFKEAVVNVTRERTIVATPVLNGKGTVKEMITDGDFKVSIQLAVVSNTTAGDFDGGEDDECPIYDVYPYNGVEQVRRMLDEHCRINIVSDFLKLFDLDGGDFGIVVESYSISQETHTNRQVIDIEAVSDYDYDLLIEQ